MRKTMITKVSDRGQVSVPADVRKALGIGPGISIKWELLQDGCAVVTAVKTAPADGAKGLLGYAERFRKLRRTDEWFI